MNRASAIRDRPCHGTRKGNRRGIIKDDPCFQALDGPGDVEGFLRVSAGLESEGAEADAAQDPEAAAAGRSGSFSAFAPDKKQAAIFRIGLNSHFKKVPGAPQILELSVPPAWLASGISRGVIHFPPRLIHKVTEGKHALAFADLLRLPEALADPVGIFSSRRDGEVFLAMTDLVEPGAGNVIAAVSPGKSGQQPVYRILSTYGKRASELVQYIIGEPLYLNKRKVREWVQHTRVQFPSGASSRGHIKFATEADVVKFASPGNDANGSSRSSSFSLRGTLPDSPRVSSKNDGEVNREGTDNQAQIAEQNEKSAGADRSGRKHKSILSESDIKEASLRYAELVGGNVKWKLESRFNLKYSLKQQRAIRKAAIESGMIRSVGYKPGTEYLDFESAGLVIHSDTLPPELWTATDDEQFAWLNARLPGGARVGAAWHHSEIDGRMELVPYGIHRIMQHRGGRAEGHWAYAPRKRKK